MRRGRDKEKMLNGPLLVNLLFYLLSLLKVKQILLTDADIKNPDSQAYRSCPQAIHHVDSD